MTLRFLIQTAALLASTCSTTAFVTTAHTSVAFHHAQQQQHQASSSQPLLSVRLFSNHKNDGIENFSQEPAIAIQELAPLALKMAGVLTVKTAKDVVNYPPKLFDSVVRSAGKQDQTSPVVMLVKLMGVLVFKLVHDATYYPLLWTQRMTECQSLDECDVPPEEQ